MPQEPLRSAFVDLVMKDDTEAERREAARHWFDFLEALLKIAKEDEQKQAREKADTSI